MPRVRRVESASAEADSREANRQAAQHGVAELGRETALLQQLAPRALGQGRRRQRAVREGLRVGWQGTDAEVRARLHRAQTRPPAPHALRLDESWEVKRANTRRITAMKTFATLSRHRRHCSAAALAADTAAHRRPRLRRARAGQLHAAGHQARRRRSVARLRGQAASASPNSRADASR